MTPNPAGHITHVNTTLVVLKIQYALNYWSNDDNIYVICEIFNMVMNAA